MPNHLVNENSPYLLQHAENPVDWYPWGPEALERARVEDKPIFLSIGYTACHWCHVMAHESFEDPVTAALLNAHFINIKVDREERPDLDSIYMSAVVALTGQGGWPMSVFLSPDGVPFYGGTYYPPRPSYGMPSFQELLRAIQRAWQTERERLTRAGSELLGHIQMGGDLAGSHQAITPGTLDQAALKLAQNYDWQFGGWGKAPKFPQPMALDFCFRRASRGDAAALQLAKNALDAMARGGIYDVIGGGFARYSTDNHWLVPHFEKMLYDNAQLARVYLYGYLLTRDNNYLKVCTQTLDFIARELRSAPGGFYSSLDADSEGGEGAYYMWSQAEIDEVLSTRPGDQAVDAKLFQAAYATSPTGNFEGSNILQQRITNAELATMLELSEAQVLAGLDQIHRRLFEIRSRRTPPQTDDKVLTAWNALALTAFAEAARYLKRVDYQVIARENANFLLGEMVVEGELLRSWRKGLPRHSAYLEDYAALILGLLALYQTDPNPRWYAAAEMLAGEVQAHFSDPAGGFFDTRSDQEALILRPKDLQDNATPCGSSLAALAFLQLSSYSGRDEWRELVEGMLAGIGASVERYPTAFAQWLCALDFYLSEVKEVAVLGAAESPVLQAMINQLWSAYRPDVLAAISEFPPPEGSPALLANRPLVGGQPSAYVCRRFVCQVPVITAVDLQLQLEG